MKFFTNNTQFYEYSGMGMDMGWVDIPKTRDF